MARRWIGLELLATAAEQRVVSSQSEQTGDLGLSMPNTFRRLLPGISAFAIYALFSLWLFSPIPDLRRVYAGVGTDPFLFIWALRWWPWAVAHGMNPFVTKFMWYPEGVNLTWVTSVPAVAFLALPVTLLANAVVSWNVVTLLAPALSAWAMFRLARHITRDFTASFVGGYIFGFSTFELFELYGHMQLDLLRLRDHRGRVKFIAGVSALLLFQIGLSTEVFATTCIFGAMAWLVFFPFVDADGRCRLCGSGGLPEKPESP
jgi:hypothetical protein